MESTSQLDEEEGAFEFETEHTILRNNIDYCNLIKYVVLLESMRAKALKDIDELALAQCAATEDPDTFIQALKNEELNLPSRQVIPNLPQVDWAKYGMEDAFKGESGEGRAYEMDADGEMKVRGRAFSDSKPETFNQLWSCEEQRRLEELLELYPEEEVEARRYKKIAAALGTRTQTQVYSRVQKYFLKLAKLGLPIPGRAPKKKVFKERNRQVNPFYKKSTFFPELHVPVRMEDGGGGQVKEEAGAEGGTVVELLKRAREQRLLDAEERVWQEGVRCVGCRRVGFVGARWTDHAGTDYCTDCVVQLEPVEKLTPIRTPP